jgi:ABC-type lipoprotein export system ATPase subunit
LKDGVGQGVRTIISFILKAYYLINKDSKLLFLDEKYSALSDHYVPRFFEFMKKMADERGMILVLITHDTRFSEYADKTYLVNDGHASLMEQGNVDEKREE